MTDIRQTLITDLLPGEAAYGAELQALAYALLKEKQRILDYADKTRTITMIDLLPESVLDVLAVELRSPYYSDELSLEQKRDVIKNILVWYKHSGTAAAMNEMIRTLTGSGSVIEWFDFEDGEGVPGTFDVVAGGTFDSQAEARFRSIIDQVKNVRSHLRRLIASRESIHDLYAATAAYSSPIITITVQGG